MGFKSARGIQFAPDFHLLARPSPARALDLEPNPDLICAALDLRGLVTVLLVRLRGIQISSWNSVRS